MPKIFISYRREDSSYLAGIIATRLASAFGRRKIVLDVDNIPTGGDFREHIKKELESCDCLVALIGTSWLTVCDESGRPRLENSGDWVRIELETALGRANKIPVIPVLLENVSPPKAEQLPESLRNLAYRQAHSVRPPADFDYDVETLIQRIKGRDRTRRQALKRTSKARRRVVLGSVALVATFAVLQTLNFFKKPNGAGFDDRTAVVNQEPSRTAKRPSESFVPSEKSFATAPKTPQVKRNGGGEPIALAGTHPTAPFKAVSPPTSAARTDGQFDGSLAGQLRDVKGLKLVWIPPGEFMMGSPKDFPHDADPVQVTLTKGFWLGQYEVTQLEWRRVMQSTPWKGKRKEEGDGYPAAFMTWDEATRFCETQTEQEHSAGRLPMDWRYTLPTEAQWEYACRAGTRSRFSFGDDYSKLSDYAWWGGLWGDGNTTSEQYPHQVGKKKANPWGLYDMHGNVFEWCNDWYAEKLAGGTDPQGPLSEGSQRVIRGGGWLYEAKQCRSADRRANGPGIRRGYIGFRVAAVPSGKERINTSAEEKRPTVAEVVAHPVGPQPNVVTTAPEISAAPVLVRGGWRIENDELVQPTLATGDEFFPLLVFGEPTLSNYDLTLEAKKTGGQEALGVFFHWLGPGHNRYFCLGGNKAAGNRGIDFGFHYNGKWGREQDCWKWQNYASNRWYSLKVEVRGDTFRAYLDGVLQYERQTDGRFTQGRICLYTDDTAARFRHIKVTDPLGNVLFGGLPDLPPAGNNATSKASVGNNPQLLTAGERAAKSAQQYWAERSKTPVISTNSLGMKLALIPPGEFAMGSPVSEQKRRGNEQQHHIRITKPFYLGVYEVTQSEFERVMGRNPSKFSNNGGRAEAATGVDTSRNPVERVSWFDAIEFCNKLSVKEGRRPYYRIADVERDTEGWIKAANVSIEGGVGYRLPTEAQWEYACRAGTTTPFNFGTTNNGTECNCNGGLPYGTEEHGQALGRTVPVGSYRANAFGLYDMHGNVCERCWDIFEGAYWKHSPESDPVGSSQPPKVIGDKSKTENRRASDPAGHPETPDRVVRGGGWLDPAMCRAACRSCNPPDQRNATNGFRVARSSEG